MNALPKCFFSLAEILHLQMVWVYSKVGFTAIDEALIPAPFILSFPHGWLAQSLNAKPIEQISSPIKCVAALMDEKYW